MIFSVILTSLRSLIHVFDLHTYTNEIFLIYPMEKILAEKKMLRLEIKIEALRQDCNIFVVQKNVYPGRKSTQSKI